MEPIDMFAVIVAGVAVAGGESCINHALIIIGCLTIMLGVIYISRVEGDLS